MATNDTDRPYPFLFDQPNGREAALALAQDIERRGYPGLWIPSRGDNLALSLAVLERTQRITVGTGIAHIYLRHPQVMAEAASLIEELHPGRFTLGIGVSHGPQHAQYGLTPGKPLGDTRNYVERMRRAVAPTGNQSAAPFPRLVLAALRRKMTALAADIAEGAIWANGLRSHLPASLQEVPADRRGDPDRFLVGNLVVTSISDDRDEAYEWARRGLLTYFRLPNYLNYFEEAGYHDEAAAARAAMDRGGAGGDEQDLLAAISDRFVEDACLVGTPAQAREQAQAFRDAGVHQLVLTPHSPRGRTAAVEAIFRTFD